MKTALGLNLSQQLALTPQLQQAIRLLQLSSLELQQEVQEAIENNPLLELEETSQENKTQPLDSSTFGSNFNTKSSNSDNDVNLEAINAERLTLCDHLLWQMRLTPFSDTDRAIATAIIEAINDDGFLTVSAEDILFSLGPLPDEQQVDLDEVLAVLHRIQRFDPIGVGARDLAECLSVQLQQLPDATQGLTAAKKIAANHLDLLATRHYQKLQKLCRISSAELARAEALIQSLDPKPGANINSAPPEYVIPDVLVEKQQGHWQVQLNPEALPKLKVNQLYQQLATGQSKSTDEGKFVRSHLQEARWFIKSLHSRHDTLLRVAKAIVSRQKGFLEHGEEAMQPMVLHDIAADLDLHESTVSRITTQKYIHTPKGLFELKYFFSSHVSTATGGECSSTAIRAIIKKLVANEHSLKPLSDNKMAQLLAEQGINVARRTVAKYREAMGIAPSNERKAISHRTKQ